MDDCDDNTGHVGQLQRFSAGRAPAGVTCQWCEESITQADDGFIVPNIGGPKFIHYHFACFLRTILGSLGHQQRRCSCYGGNLEDPPNMTRRQAARATVAYWHAKNN